MKRYLIILMIISVLISVLLVGCAQEAELEKRITNLETKLTAAESTIEVLQGKIEQLEKANQESLYEADILRTLQGKTYWAHVGLMGYMQIKFGPCLSLSK